MTFHSFSDLPTEIRLQIWNQSLPTLAAREPRLIPYDPSCWIRSHISNRCEMIYNHSRHASTHIQLPTVMVNKESYNVAKPWLTAQGIHWKADKGWCVPFDPDSDALYLSQKEMEHFDAGSTRRIRERFAGNEEELVVRRCAVKRVAVDLGTLKRFRGDRIMGIIGYWLRGVRTVLVIVRDERVTVKESIIPAGERAEVTDWGWEDAQGCGLKWDEQSKSWSWDNMEREGEKLNENLVGPSTWLSFGDTDYTGSSLRELRAVVSVTR
ncbi:hypothetical protein K461DRAFT_324975 [Myriangium duriaei CBS 260.36]|uniref:2EXR domain-containing protein n=1 Tax=Myriangium duriaei CBS 260.36 TaxID=1168546 RepID=A0A9P4ISS8_9PEZI|nr:hypothetical protein K461DRAFT_324975 [Myriangium duriaei CBS 260.36]